MGEAIGLKRHFWFYSLLSLREEKGDTAMKYFALGFVALLAMATVSMAAYSVQVLPGVDLSDPNNVLMSYTVRFTGVNAWQDLKITGGTVHQMNYYKSTSTPPLKQTCWSSSTYFDADLGSPDALPYDTHINDLGLPLAFGVGTTAVGVETTDNLNPGGLTIADFTPINRAGMGTFDTTGTAYAISGTAAPYYDLVQVVVLKNQAPVRLMGLYADTETAAMHSLDLEISGIPEPGTIALLVAGALCLLGIRRK
jgi:hypothetical protein